MLTDTQKLFLLSTVNGQPNFQELLPVNGFDFPKETWLQRQRQRRIEEARKEQEEND